MWHMSLAVNGSESSHWVPSAYAEHRPVEGSQVPPGMMHGLLGDDPVAGHPKVKQSPTMISSRPKSPVQLDPAVYVNFNMCWWLLCAYTVT
jgi:hypothetical protein